MATTRYALVLDVGTTGTKCFVFSKTPASANPHVLAKAYRTYPVRSPKRGWAEQDPERILNACRRVIKDAVIDSGISPANIASFGLTNQRETTVLWDAKTLKPIYPAIVWEDRRTARSCAARRPTHASVIRKKTGLTLDAYFSASKIEWILTHVPAAQMLSDVGRLRFGTIDSWLLANLCTGNPHVTDETNAARTLLFNLRTRAWDPDLCALFGVPERILPAILPPNAEFGLLHSDILGRSLPVRAVIGDQQSSMAAAIVCARRSAGATKVTYGTGTFVMQLLGDRFVIRDGFFTTLVPFKRGTAYALEAKIAVSGPEVAKRLRRPAELERYLRKLAMNVNSAIKRLPEKPKELIVDGGISRSPLLAPIQSEISGIPVRPLPTFDGTALGVAIALLRS